MKYQKKAFLHPFGSLSDFFSATDPTDRIAVSFKGSPSVKDLIESEGIPHVEVFGLSINNKIKSLDYNMNHGDEVKIYPLELTSRFEKFRIKFPGNIPLKFVTDVHLGKLTRLLRLLGVDTETDSQYRDKQVVSKSISENRTVLTRDIELLKHGSLEHGYWVRSTNPDQQAGEILNRYPLEPLVKPFSRCLECNGLIRKVEFREVKDDVPPDVQKYKDEYYECDQCEKVYWKGSHYKDLKKKTGQLLDLV